MRRKYFIIYGFLLSVFRITQIIALSPTDDSFHRDFDTSHRNLGLKIKSNLISKSKHEFGSSGTTSVPLNSELLNKIYPSVTNNGKADTTEISSDSQEVNHVPEYDSKYIADENRKRPEVSTDQSFNSGSREYIDLMSLLPGIEEMYYKSQISSSDLAALKLKYKNSIVNSTSNSNDTNTEEENSSSQSSNLSTEDTYGTVIPLSNSSEYLNIVYKSTTEFSANKLKEKHEQSLTTTESDASDHKSMEVIDNNFDGESISPGTSMPDTTLSDLETITQALNEEDNNEHVEEYLYTSEPTKISATEADILVEVDEAETTTSNLVDESITSNDFYPPTTSFEMLIDSSMSEESEPSITSSPYETSSSSNDDFHIVYKSTTEFNSDYLKNKFTVNITDDLPSTNEISATEPMNSTLDTNLEDSTVLYEGENIEESAATPTPSKVYSSTTEFDVQAWKDMFQQILENATIVQNAHTTENTVTQIDMSTAVTSDVTSLVGNISMFTDQSVLLNETENDLSTVENATEVIDSVANMDSESMIISELDKKSQNISNSVEIAYNETTTLATFNISNTGSSNISQSEEDYLGLVYKSTTEFSAHKLKDKYSNNSVSSGNATHHNPNSNDIFSMPLEPNDGVTVMTSLDSADSIFMNSTDSDMSVGVDPSDKNHDDDLSEAMNNQSQNMSEGIDYSSNRNQTMTSHFGSNITNNQSDSSSFVDQNNFEIVYKSTTEFSAIDLKEKFINDTTSVSMGENVTNKYHVISPTQETTVQSTGDFFQYKSTTEFSVERLKGNYHNYSQTNGTEGDQLDQSENITTEPKNGFLEITGVFSYNMPVYYTPEGMVSDPPGNSTFTMRSPNGLKITPDGTSFPSPTLAPSFSSYFLRSDEMKDTIYESLRDRIINSAVMDNDDDDALQSVMSEYLTLSNIQDSDEITSKITKLQEYLDELDSKTSSEFDMDFLKDSDTPDINLVTRDSYGRSTTLSEPANISSLSNITDITFFRADQVRMKDNDQNINQAKNQLFYDNSNILHEKQKTEIVHKILDIITPLSNQNEPIEIIDAFPKTEDELKKIVKQITPSLSHLYNKEKTDTMEDFPESIPSQENGNKFRQEPISNNFISEDDNSVYDANVLMGEDADIKNFWDKYQKELHLLSHEHPNLKKNPNSDLSNSTGSNKVGLGTIKFSQLIENSMYPRRSRRHDFRCMDPSVTYGCATCGSVVMCLEGNAYLYDCQFPEMSCHEDAAFSGAVCKAGRPSVQCSCNEGQLYKSDPYDHISYILCNPEPTLFSCEAYQEFDIEKSRCVAMPIGPHCTALGVFPNLNDCRWYQVCRWSAMLGNFHQSNLRCQKDFMYSISHRTCVEQSDLPEGDLCVRNGEESSQSLRLDSLDVLDEGDYSIEDVGISPDVVTTKAPSLSPRAEIKTTESHLGSVKEISAQAAKVEPFKTYSCPYSVYLLVHWLPQTAEYMCSLVSN